MCLSMYRSFSFMVLINLFLFQGCKGKDDFRKIPDTNKDEIKTIIPASSITKMTVFNAGDGGIAGYRIPSLVTTKEGTLLLFCEARKNSWKDKSPTDVVLKRSTDNGQTWSPVKTIFSGGNNAYMDPCPVVDHITGRIFLFSVLVLATDNNGLTHTSWLSTSDDDGLTWSSPRDVSTEIIASGFYSAGFGPGSGFQMKGSKYKDRLIVPVRQSNGTRTRNRALYSDDYGVTWKIGEEAYDGGEFQIAESPLNTLINNRRADSKRYKAKSMDGGISWSNFSEDVQLRTVPGGCHGSIFGSDDVLFYTGPTGGPSTSEFDYRANFTIYRSINGGDNWTKQYLLFDKASGYSCITQLKDGSIAIVFEAADTPGFTRNPVDRRPDGWMRLDVLVLPKEVLNKDHWFTK